MSKYFLIFIGLLISPALSGGISNIEGKVLDSNTKKPLAYASIAVSGKNMGTVSNSDGYFVLSAENLSGRDTILFSYMGFETLKIPYKEALKRGQFFLKTANINLSEIKVYSRNLSVSEILDKVVENYPENHPKRNERNRIFIHNFVRTPFSGKNKASIIKSNFKGLDKTKFDNLFEKIPKVFIDYNDAIFDYYSYDESTKLIPIQGISIEEGDQEKLLKEVEKQLAEFIGDFEQTLKNPDVYYKFKTGLLGVKLDTDGDGQNTEVEIENDSLSFKIPISTVKYETKSLIEDYSRLEGDNTDFLNKHGKYKFELLKLEFYNGELVYRIKFKPKSTGIFEGEIFISSTDFGIHQMDYSYAEGKSTENFQLLGIGHAIKYRKARIIFEKKNNSYHLKYISAEENEMAALDRKFSLLKKEKRFLFDKELNQIKFDVDLLFDVHSKWELLVLEHETISDAEFEKIKQPRFMKFQKQTAHSSKDWESRTYIVPNDELKKYTRKSLSQ